MTVGELVREVFEGAGEPEDLQIYQDDGVTMDLSLAGSLRVLGFLNRAYERVSNWQLPDGRIIRFASMNRRLIFQVNTVSLVVSSATVSSVIVTGGSASDDHYVEWTILSGSEYRVCIAYDAATGTLTPHKAFATAPSGTVTLLKRFFAFVSDVSALHTGEAVAKDPQEVVAVQSLYDLTADRPLERMDRTEDFSDSLQRGTSAPGLWRQIGGTSGEAHAGGIEFDAPPPDAEVFLMRYYGRPETLSAEAQVPKIPASWHEALLYLAIWITMKRDRATDEAYSMKRDIQDMIVQTVQQGARAFEFENGALYFKD